MSDKLPVFLSSGARGFHFSVEVVAIGMATNLLGSAGGATGGWGVAAAGCFLVAGIIALYLIQVIEAASANALALVASESAKGNTISFPGQYRKEVAKKGAVAFGKWLGRAESLIVGAGVALFWIDRYGGTAAC